MFQDINGIKRIKKFRCGDFLNIKNGVNLLQIIKKRKKVSMGLNTHITTISAEQMNVKLIEAH